MAADLTDAEVDLFCRRIASDLSTGSTHRDVQARLGITQHQFRKLLASAQTQLYLREISEETGKQALTSLKKGIASMADLTLKALEKNLKAGSMQAVRTALEVMGALERDVSGGSETAITVVLPGESHTETKVLAADFVQVDSSTDSHSS